MKPFKMFVGLVLVTAVGIIWMNSFHHVSSAMGRHQKERQRPPHIVFILADDFGWNDIGYHGAEFPTPNLDALAESGVKLENYYVQPKCSPTRGQLMSGRYQIHTGLQSTKMQCSSRCGLPLEFPTMADLLRENGYATHIVGKWHLGFYKRSHLPTHRGFDSHYGYYKAGQDYFTHYSGGALDFHYNEEPLYNETGYSTHLFRDQAIKVMNNHSKQAASDPLFLYLSFQAVHAPTQVPDNYTVGLSHIEDTPRKLHAGMVIALDEAVGDIKKALQNSGLWDNTLLIFSSDNGGQPRTGGSNWPLRGKKGTYWEGGIRSPAFAAGPVLPRGGAISKALMHVTDWFPTFVHLAGGDTSGMDIDGHDIWQSIRSDAPSPRKEILHNIVHQGQRRGEPLPNSSFDNSHVAAIRVDKWKLLTGNPGYANWMAPPTHLGPAIHLSPDDGNRTKNIYLFNIEEDPEERHDLSDDHPDIVMMMLEKVAKYDATALPPLVETPDPKASPEADGVWGPWVN